MKSDELKFHVMMCSDNPKKGGDPVFVYVGTPEEAAIKGMELQKTFDLEDRVNSKWKRKRHIRIESPHGRIGEETLEIITKAEPKLIGMDMSSEQAKTYQSFEEVEKIEDGDIIDVDSDS